MRILHLFFYKEGRKGCICGKGDKGSLTVETIIINDEKAER